MATAAPAPLASTSAWAPLRHRAFRILWAAQFASNVGTWMQTGGAQWLIGDLGGSSLDVSLVQTSTSQTVFLLALPSGALGDILDRRKVLIFGQAAMLVAAAALALLTASDAVTPLVVLGLVFALGAGQAFVTPSWQAVQPELVPRAEIPQAAVLNGTSFNLARAVGPAIGGVLITTAGAEAVFAINAVSFVAVLIALGTWQREAPPKRFAAHEGLGSALAAGLRYVRATPSFRTVLARSVHFMLFASALWALLPVIARDELGLGAGGYGLMLGAVGVGAVAGALTLPRIRSKVGVEWVVSGACVVLAVALLVVGLSGAVAAAMPALVLAGAAWIANNSSLNASAQVLVPSWARARALSFYTLCFMGAQALGAVLWGTMASQTSTGLALAVAAAGLVGGAAVLRLRRPLVARDYDLTPHGEHSEPDLVIEAAPASGPVLVRTEWRVAPAQVAEFRDAMRLVERARRRTGARRWGLFQDGEDPELFLEAYVVGTWEEHERQRSERFTVRDAELEARAIALTVDGEQPRVRPAISAYR